MLAQLIQWIMVDSSSLGSGYLTRGTSELGRPMMLLNVLQEVCGDDATKRKQYEKEIAWSIQKIQTHLQVNKQTNNLTNKDTVHLIPPNE